MIFKHVIFDFDGVIINSYALQKKAFKAAYRSLFPKGRPPYEEFFQHSGNSLENIFQAIGLPQSAVSIFREISRANIQEICLFQPVIAIAAEVVRRGSTCSLCTGKDRRRTEEILDHFGIRSLFNLVVCSDDITHPKPHPESIEVIREHFHAQRNQIVMVGDSVNDILCAKKAGVFSIAVAWGDTNLQQLHVSSPDKVAIMYEDLSEFLFSKQSPVKESPFTTA